MKVWLVLLCRSWPEDRDRINHTRHVVGVFDSSDKALEACRTEAHFAVPLQLNADLGDGSGFFDDVLVSADSAEGAAGE